MINNSNAKVKALTLVSGVSGSGKSTLIKSLITGKLDQKIVSHFFGNIDVAKVSVLNAFELDSTDLKDIDYLILHYDIHSSHKEDEGFLYLPDLFDVADKIKVITLCTAADVLITRMQKRLKKTYVEFIKRPGWRKLKMIRFIKSKIRLYRCNADLADFHDSWNSFLVGHKVTDHSVIDSSLEKELLLQPYGSERIRDILS